MIHIDMSYVVCARVKIDLFLKSILIHFRILVKSYLTLHHTYKYLSHACDLRPCAVQRYLTEKRDKRNSNKYGKLCFTHFTKTPTFVVGHIFQTKIQIFHCCLHYYISCSCFIYFIVSSFIPIINVYYTSF